MFQWKQRGVNDVLNHISSSFFEQKGSIYSFFLQKGELLPVNFFAYHSSPFLFQTRSYLFHMECGTPRVKQLSHKKRSSIWVFHLCFLNFLILFSLLEAFPLRIPSIYLLPPSRLFPSSPSDLPTVPPSSHVTPSPLVFPSLSPDHPLLFNMVRVTSLPLPSPSIIFTFSFPVFLPPVCIRLLFLPLTIRRVPRCSLRVSGFLSFSLIFLYFPLSRIIPDRSCSAF